MYCINILTAQPPHQQTSLPNFAQYSIFLHVYVDHTTFDDICPKNKYCKK